MARTMQIDMRASLIRDRPAYPASEYYDAIRREQYRAHAQTLYVFHSCSVLDV